MDILSLTEKEVIELIRVNYRNKAVRASKHISSVAMNIIQAPAGVNVTRQRTWYFETDLYEANNTWVNPSLSPDAPYYFGELGIKEKFAGTFAANYSYYCSGYHAERQPTFFGFTSNDPYFEYNDATNPVPVAQPLIQAQNRFFRGVWGAVESTVSLNATGAWSHYVYLSFAGWKIFNQ